MTIQLTRRLFTVDDYYRMVEAGILHEDDRVELIEGEIVEMPPIGSPHASVVNRLISLFSRTLTEELGILSVQSPVRLSDLSEPQPDVLLLRPRDDFYASRHPHPEDILLLVEVADSSVRYDREVKLPLHAKEGILNVWIVDLTAQTVEACSQPAARGYGQMQTARRGEAISPVAFPEFHLAIDAILGSHQSPEQTLLEPSLSPP